MQKFHERTFDKTEIKRRMVERATKIWQTQSSQLDGYDPLVGLLFEACAVELEKIANEIHSTSDRVIDRLANLMNPEVVDIIRPAHAIIQTKAIDPFTVVMPQEQFFYKAPAGFGVGYNANREFFFSPIMPFKIFNGEVKYMATSTAIYKVDEGLQKTMIHNSKSFRGKEVVDFQRLWIGIDLHDELKTIEGMSIFFDWQNDPQKENHLRKLPQTQWFIDEIELPFKIGIFPEYSESLSLDDEFDAMKRFEIDTKQFYNKCFISFKSEEYDLRRLKTAENKEKKWPIIKKIYPPEFEKLFDKDNLVHKFKGEMLWLEARFPIDFDADSFQNIYCSINCFPIMNRKINQLTYTLQENLNIIPLASDEPFLAVRNISNDENSVIYKSSPFTNLESLEFDSYTLRQQGVGRFDSRDAKGLLYYVLELLQDESKAFEALGSDFLNSIIKELNQNIAQLDQQLKLSDDNNQIQSGSIPYVALRPRKAENNLNIEFWSCDGEEANEISAGSPLAAYSDIYIDSDKVMLLTTSNGGRSKLKETEKVNALKKNLLTRNRIVTHEDIRVTCWALLGDEIRDLTIEKNFMTSHASSEGFIRCIQIVLFPTKKSMEKNWDVISQELKIALEGRSATNLPFNILYYIE